MGSTHGRYVELSTYRYCSTVSDIGERGEEGEENNEDAESEKG